MAGRNSSTPLPDACRTLTYRGGRVALCMPDKLLYGYHFNEFSTDFKTPVGKIIRTKKPEVIGLYNASDMALEAAWQGEKWICAPQGRTPLFPGMTLKAGNTIITVT